MSTPDPTWTIHREADTDPEIRARIIGALEADAAARGAPGHPEPFVLTVRDADGAVVGGLWGRSNYGLLLVELLALGPAKGRGLGQRLMRMAEEEALRRGCSAIWLDTWTFQAPAFYRRLGFNEFGRLADPRSGHDRIFFVKRLGDPSSDGTGAAGS